MMEKPKGAILGFLFKKKKKDEKKSDAEKKAKKKSDRLKELKDNLIGENLRIQSQLWQVNCYMQDAIKRNNAIMAEDIAKWEFTKRGGKKNA